MLNVAPHSKHISIMADDADIFVLALHHYPSNLKCKVTMESLTNDTKVIDIGLTFQKHKNTVPYLLQLHAFTGNDITGSYCSIGKRSALSLLLKNKLTFSHLGDMNVDFSLVLSEALTCLSQLYGISKITCKDVSELRYQVWCKKMGKAKQLVLKNLPPTENAFIENVKRAHYCAALWKSACESYPVEVTLTDYGWIERDNVLIPNIGEIFVAPPEIVKMLSCRTGRCSCNRAKLSCTVFCSCKTKCDNPNSAPMSYYDEDDDDE